MSHRAKTVPLFRWLSTAGLVLAGSVAPAAAQQAARPVVQALPSPGVSDLNAALLRLARNSEDVAALLDAGIASLKLGDNDAAIGFFSRADSISGGNARAKAGLASAFVRQQNPYDALLMFDEAEKAGGNRALMAGDRGLAYDLVGDNAHAQELYRLALATGPDDEVSKRLALSLAVTGDRAGSEAALRPLLERRDLGAYRTRAFAMAILGDAKEAQAIADVRLPPESAARLGPYLRYMPRLTAAQQVAAANFGRFPRTAEIGRDDPRVAVRTGSRSADAGLIPRGEPLGRKSKATDDGADRRRRDKDQSAIAVARPVSAPVPTSPVATSPRAIAPAWPPPSAPPPSAQTRPAPAPEPSRLATEPMRGATSPQTPAPAPVANAQVYGPPDAPTGDARVSAQPGPPAPAVAQAPPPPAPAPPASNPAGAPRPRVVDVFADLALPLPPARPAEGAVDVTRLPKREARVDAKAPSPAKAKTPPPPPKPKHPSRIWVQVGTGRDKAALAYDWRRYAKTQAKLFKGKTAHVASWGKTNRLLAGPFASEKVAQAFLADLKKADINSFAFTSKEGEPVDPLD